MNSSPINHCIAKYLMYIFNISGDCFRDFVLLFNSSHKLVSDCNVIEAHSDVTLDSCKFLACDASANTINYRASLCTLLNCGTGGCADPRVTPVAKGWDIYQIAGKTIVVVYIVTASVAQCHCSHC